MSAQLQTKEALGHLLPWNRRVLWWVVLTEGIVVAGFGLFMLLLPQAGLITIGIAVYLIVEGTLTLIRVLRQSPLDHTAAAQLMRGTAALVVGLVVFVPRVLVSLIITTAQQQNPMFNPIMVLDQATFRLFLAVAATGVALVAILRFYEATRRRMHEGRIGSILAGLALLVLAGIGFAASIGGVNAAFAMGLFALIIGTILIVYAIFLRLRPDVGSSGTGQPQTYTSAPADTLQPSSVQDTMPVEQIKAEPQVESGP